MTGPHDWLDKHIVEQAKAWGLSPQKKAALFKGAAEFDEMLTAGVVEEPTKEIRMKTYTISATYHAGTEGKATLPEGRTWEDVKDWHVKWDTLYVTFNDGTEWDTELGSDFGDIIDTKRPLLVTVYAVGEDGETDYEEEVA